MKILREEIGPVSEADFSLCSGLLKEKSNEADGPEIESTIFINFGVVPNLNPMAEFQAVPAKRCAAAK